MDTQIATPEAPHPPKKAPPVLVINGDDMPAPGLPPGLLKHVKGQMGQAYRYDREATMDAICHIIATTPKSLNSICKMEGSPDISRVMRWMEEDDDLREKYTRAKELQADLLAGSVPEIAMTPMIVKRVKRKEDDEGNRSVEEVEVDNVERSRLVVDAYKWYAAKLAPKKYGDRLQTDLNVQVESHEQRLARLTGGGK